MKGIKYIILILIFLLQSCKDKMEAKEYLHYLQNEKNGVYHEVRLQNKLFISQFITNDWYVIKEREIDEYIKKDEVGFIYSVKNIDGTHPLEANSESEMTYYEKLAIVNQMTNELFYIEDQDGEQYDNLFAQVEIGYDVSSHLNFILIFRKPKNFESLRIVFNDVFWGNGLVKHTINNSDISNIPVLIKKKYDTKN